MVSDDLITWYQLNNIVTGPGHDYSLANIIFNEDSTSLFTLILGKSWSTAKVEFFTTYALSIISAALGLAKCLKNGVARPIGDGGCLDGLLSVRTALAFLASGFLLGSRGVCLGFVVGVINILYLLLSQA